MLMGGLILAIMILPFITAVSREVIKAVPRPLSEAAFGLGATHWEAIKGPVSARGAVGHYRCRHFGIGARPGRNNGDHDGDRQQRQRRPEFVGARFSTISSKLANQFAEADGAQYTALMYLALVLVWHYHRHQRFGPPVDLEYGALQRRQRPRLSSA